MRMRFVSMIVALCLWSGVSAAAQGKREATVTLLPVRQAGDINNAGASSGLLWIQNAPLQAAFLQFDLGSLPSDVAPGDITEVTLRLVAKEVRYQPAGNENNTGGSFVSVSAQFAKNDFSGVESSDAVAALQPPFSPDRKVAFQTSPDLRDAVRRRYQEDKKISLKLVTGSDKAGSLFYSMSNFDNSPSNKPRLVIKYTLGAPGLLETLAWPQSQQNPEHTGRSSWKPFNPPTGFTMDKIDLPRTAGGPGTVADYPLIYGGNIYFVNPGSVNASNFLVALDYKGAELWRKDIGAGTIQRSPVIGRNGILYTVTERQLAAYDLKSSGQPAGTYPIPGKLSPFTDVTVGNDGSLFLAMQEGGNNYIYGFTAGLIPFLKWAPSDKILEKVSTVTVSVDGRKVFAQTPDGGVVIDIVNPAQVDTLALNQAWEYYHTPIAAPTGGMIFADFSRSANTGNVWGRLAIQTPTQTTLQNTWSSPGTLIPQPVLGGNDRVYYIQGGALQSHAYKTVGTGDAPAGSGLNATSNLVLDGSNNIYFWDNGYLNGWTPNGKQLFDKQNLTAGPEARSGDGPEQFVRLMLGPDGTLWSNNRSGNSLFLFKPVFQEPSFTLKQEDIKDQTVYRAADTLTVGGVAIKDGSSLLFEAQKGISFSAGFSVQVGSSILARTGL